MSACRFAWILALVLFPATASRVMAQPRRAVYVGAKVCATCHDGKDTGQQSAIWLHSKRAGGSSPASPLPKPAPSPPSAGCRSNPRNRRSAWDATPRGGCGRLGEGRNLFGPRRSPVREVPWPRERARRFLVGRERSQGRSRDSSDQPVGSDCMKCHKDKPSHTGAAAQARGRPNRQATPFDLAQALPRSGPPHAREVEARGAGTAPEPLTPPGDRQVHRLPGLRRMSQRTRKRLPIQPLAARQARSELTIHSPRRPAGRSRRKRAWTGDPQISAACLKCHVPPIIAPPPERPRAIRHSKEWAARRAMARGAATRPKT